MPDLIPQISVIIPVYNVEKYIAACIDSVLAQTFEHFELILVDDGSKDSSGHICDAYATKDTRIRVFHQANQGASAARNYGIDHAQSEWLCFIDSDDYIGKNYLAAFFQYGKLNEDCLNMQGRNLVSDIDGKIIKSDHYPDLFVDNSHMKDVFCRYNFLSNSGPVEKLFNRKLLNRIGLRYRTDLTVREDAVFVYTYRTYMSSIQLIPVTEYYYRQAFQRRTLCHKNHHYQVFLTIREELPPLVQKTLEKWNLADTPQGQEILSYYKNQTCLSIIKSLYAYRANLQTRLSILNQIFKDKAYFQDPYFHPKPLLCLFKSLFHLLPTRLFDLFCYIPFHMYYKYVRKIKP